MTKIKKGRVHRYRHNPYSIVQTLAGIAQLAQNVMQSNPARSTLGSKKATATASKWAYSPIGSKTANRRRRTRHATKLGRKYGINRGGPYSGKFKKPRTKRQKMYTNKNGVVEKYENGSIIETTNKDTVYVGHSLAPRRLLSNIFCSVIKRLANLMNIQIANMDDTIETNIALTGPQGTQYNSFRISYYYKNTSSQAFWLVQDFSENYQANDTTWKQLADKLVADMQALFQTSDVAMWQVQTMNAQLAYYDGDLLTYTHATNLISLDMQNLYVDMEVFSNLAIQNRTNDASGGTNILSTSNNPIHGKHYLSRKKWLNGFDIARGSYASNAATPLYSYPTTGIIGATSDDYETQILKKCPPAWVLGVDKVESVKVQPGNVMQTTLRWSASMKFNTFIGKMGRFFSQPASETGGNPQKLEMGWAELFGFECMLNDRTETTALQIGWELNQVYSSSIKNRKVATVPRIEVQ